MNKHLLPATVGVAILTAVCSPASAATNATINILYNFGAISGSFGPLDGSYPVQPPTQGSDSNFYGTTFDGGTNNDGTVYQLTPQGTLTTLYSFQGYDGIGPRGLLVETNGLFYGTTQEGGANVSESSICCGTAFTMTPAGMLTTIHSFDSTDGNTADSGLVPSGDGNYYGTTYGGGTVTIPYTATNGTDSFGDSLQNPPGTVYKITPQGTLTTLYSFSGPDGANPGKEAVVGTNGDIYGTTLFGGTYNAGTIYTISSAGTFTSLYSFTGGTDGAHPKTRMLQGPDGNLYGTTLDGGGLAGAKWCSENGCGTFFMITPQGTLTTLHDFEGDPEPAHPGSLTLGPDGNFYGTSYTGGTNHEGTIFMISPQGQVTTLYQFDVVHGAEPIGGLTLASDGFFYGTTTVGGAHDQGNVFQVVLNPNADSGCVFTLSPKKVSLAAKGGTKTLSVKVKGTDCEWNAFSPDPFIIITAETDGVGTGKVTYFVPGNTNAVALDGTISVAGLTVPVHQAAGGCIFKLSPKIGKIKSAGGAATVKVASKLSDCVWTASVSTDSFITLTGGTNGIGKGEVSYTVPANTTPNVMTGTITIAGQPYTVEVAGVK